MQEENTQTSTTPSHFKKPHFYFWLILILVICAGSYAAYAQYFGKVIDPTLYQNKISSSTIQDAQTNNLFNSTSSEDTLVYSEGIYLYKYNPNTTSSSSIAIPYNQLGIKAPSQQDYNSYSIDPSGHTFFLPIQQSQESVDTKLYRFDIERNKLTYISSGDNLNVDSFSPDSKFATIDEGTGPLRTKEIISLETNKPLGYFSIQGTFNPGWSPDSKYLAYNQAGEDLYGAIGSDSSLQSIVMFNTETNSTTTILASSNNSSSTKDYSVIAWKSPTVLIYEQNTYQSPFIISTSSEISEDYLSKGDNIFENPQKQYFQIDVLSGEKVALSNYTPPTQSIIYSSKTVSPSGKWFLNKTFNASSTNYDAGWSYFVSSGSTTITIPAIGELDAAWIK